MVEHVLNPLDAIAFVRHLSLWWHRENARGNVVGRQRHVVFVCFLRIPVHGYDMDGALCAIVIDGYSLDSILGACLLCVGVAKTKSLLDLGRGDFSARWHCFVSWNDHLRLHDDRR